MKNPSCTDEDFYLWRLLDRTRDMILKVRERELRRQYGLSAMQSAVLFVVHGTRDKATPAEISRWLARETHSVSEILSRMEKRGLVRKVKDLDRKNQVRVALTEEGHKAYSQSIKAESISEIMSSLSDEESQQLGLLLQKLRDKVAEKLGIEYELPLRGS